MRIIPNPVHEEELQQISTASDFSGDFQPLEDQRLSSGDDVIFNTINGGSLSGNNTGDQDLSGYVQTSSDTDTIELSIDSGELMANVKDNSISNTQLNLALPTIENPDSVYAGSILVEGWDSYFADDTVQGILLAIGDGTALHSDWIQVDTSDFSGILSSADDNVLKALKTIDQISLGGGADGFVNIKYDCDFTGGADAQMSYPFWSGVGSGGTLQSITATPRQPHCLGSVELRSGTGINSRYGFVTQTSQGGNITGNSSCKAKFYCTRINDTQYRFGWYNQTAVNTAPTYAIYMQSVGGVVTGYCINNGSVSETASTYSLSANTSGSHYIFIIEVNTDYTAVKFTIKGGGATLSELWTDTITGGLPNRVVAGHMFHGFQAGSTIAIGSAVSLAELDYLGINANIYNRIL